MTMKIDVQTLRNLYITRDLLDTGNTTVVVNHCEVTVSGLPLSDTSVHMKVIHRTTGEISEWDEVTVDMDGDPCGLSLHWLEIIMRDLMN